LSLRRAVFQIFDFKNVVTLKTGLGFSQGHWKYHRSIERIHCENSVVHEATQSVAKMLIHTSVALSATVMWLTYSHIKCGYR